MAYREIHDDVPLSKTLNQLGHFEERLYWRLLSQTDPWGRLPGDHRKLRLLTIPELAVADNELASALERLVRVGRIDIYDERGTRVCQLLDFGERQHVARLKRAPSRYPERTALSTSPYDLNLSLPLPEHGPEACDLELSNGEPKAPAKSLIDRQKQKDRRESDLPTAEAREPARGLSVSQTLEESLAQADRAQPSGLALVPIPDLADAVAGDGLSADGFARLPAGELGLEPGTPQWLVAKLRNGDDGTVNVLEALRRKGVPPADFVLAAEMLSERQPPPKSDVRYVMGVLNNRLRERQDGAAA